VRPGSGAGFEFLLGDPELQDHLLTLVTRFGGATPDAGEDSKQSREKPAPSDPSRSLWK
jgi:hypothetical protein